MIIATNVSALSVLASLQKTGNEVADATEQLSSGFRINKASDDPAGLAIANRLRNTGAALTQAQQNAQQASAMLQIADGGANSIAQIVDRMKQLAEQGASSTVGTAGPNLDDEFQALNAEITRIVGTTQYQGTNLLSATTDAGGIDATNSTYTTAGSDIASVTLNGAAASTTFTIANTAADNGVITLTDGTTTQSLLATNGAQSLNFNLLGVTINTAASFATGGGSTSTVAGSADGEKVVTTASPGTSSSLSFRVDATGDDSNDVITVDLGSISALGSTINVADQTHAAAALTAVNTLEDSVNSFLGTLGAAESRLNYASQNLTTEAANTSAAEAAIRDVDMASEMSQYSSANILQQTGTAMLAQANSNAQQVLRLFQ